MRQAALIIYRKDVPMELIYFLEDNHQAFLLPM